MRSKSTSTLFWVSTVLFALLFLYIRVDAESDQMAEDTAQGWNPTQATAWANAQMDYAKAVQKYGDGSPEATEAQVLMNTLGRKLGVAPTAEVPQRVTVPPLVADTSLDDDVDTSGKNSPPLNAPAPLNVDAPVASTTTTVQ